MKIWWYYCTIQPISSRGGRFWSSRAASMPLMFQLSVGHDFSDHSRFGQRMTAFIDSLGEGLAENENAARFIEPMECQPVAKVPAGEQVTYES